MFMTGSGPNCSKALNALSIISKSYSANSIAIKSFAIFTAIRRASSRVSKRSQRRPTFFNDGYAAALPTIAPFFFESETAGLTFDRHR